MLFKSRLIPIVLLSQLFLLGGCEERAETVQASGTFKLVVPVENSSVYETTDKTIKVKHYGTASNANIFLKLNGSDVTEQFIPNDNFSDTVVASMFAVRNSLVQGDNTLFVGERLVVNNVPQVDGNGQPVFVATDTFHFYLDTIAPRITVDTITPVAVGVDGVSPAAGTQITVTGNIVDDSDITELKFTSPGGTVILTSTTNDPVGINQFNNTTKKYSVNLLNYPNTTVATSNPHFTYTATDIAEHSRTERFMAPGTPIARQKALQINDSLTWTFADLPIIAMRNAFDTVNLPGINALGTGFPRRVGDNALPSPGDLIVDPFVNCTDDVLGTIKICNPYGSVRVYIYPYPREPVDSGSNPCNSQLFDRSKGVTHCVVFLEKVSFVPDFLDFTFHDGSTLMMDLDLWIKYAAADVQVAGIRVIDGNPDTEYLGALRGNVSLGYFSVNTGFQLSPNPTNFVLDITRTKDFNLNLVDLLQVPQVYGTCNICSPLVSPLTLIVMALGLDATGNGVPDKTDALNAANGAMENAVGPYVDFLVGNLKSASTTYPQNPAGTKEITRQSAVVNAYTVYERNPHFVFNGSHSVDLNVSPDPAAALVNGGLGSLFDEQGKYYTNFPFIKGWGIGTRGVLRNVDASFAVSANSVNQWILAKFQAGMFDFDEPGIEFTAADVAAADLSAIDLLALDLNVDYVNNPAEVLYLSLRPNEAPKVQFSGEDTRSRQICLGTLCSTKAATLGSVKLVANDLDIRLDNQDLSLPVLDANIDLEFEVELNASGGLPKVTLVEDSVMVRVNSFTQPTSLLATNSLVGSAIAKGLVAYMASPKFESLLSPQAPVKFSISSIPTIGNFGDACIGETPGIGEFCAGGMVLAYRDFFNNPDDLPRDFGIMLRWLRIEKGGSYLSVGIDVRNKPVIHTDPLQRWTAGELAENFKTVRLCGEFVSSPVTDPCYQP